MCIRKQHSLEAAQATVAELSDIKWSPNDNHSHTHKHTRTHPFTLLVNVRNFLCLQSNQPKMRARFSMLIRMYREQTVLFCLLLYPPIPSCLQKSLFSNNNVRTWNHLYKHCRTRACCDNACYGDLGQWDIYWMDWVCALYINGETDTTRLEKNHMETLCCTSERWFKIYNNNSSNPLTPTIIRIDKIIVLYVSKNHQKNCNICYCNLDLFLTSNFKQHQCLWIHFQTNIGQRTAAILSDPSAYWS